MTEELLDDAVYLLPGEEVSPLIWHIPFSAQIAIPLRVSPLLGENGKPKKTLNGRFVWKAEERPHLVTEEGTPRGPLKIDETYEGRPLILTTKSADAAKRGRSLKRSRRV